MKKRKNLKHDGMASLAIIAVILIGSLLKNNMLIILLLVLFILFFSTLWKYYQKKKVRLRYLTSGMKEVDRLTGEEFEYFLCTYFKALGYIAKVTLATNDYGADIILNKDSEKIVVQAKRYKENVGIKAVQEVVGAKGYYRADKAIVFTCSYFTPNAKKLAFECGVELWDRTKLKEIMEQVQGKTLIEEMKKEERYQGMVRNCPKCGARMVVKNGNRGYFYGCENFPDCKFTKSF